MTWLKRIAQSIFIAIFTFEFLNAVHLLSFKIEYSWFGVTLSTAVIFVGISLIESLCSQKLEFQLPGVVWFMGLVLILNDFVGDVLGAYARWEHYDQLIHGLSGVILVGFFLLLFEGVARRQSWRVPPVILYALALGMNMIGAVLYEIEEYSEDVFFGSRRLGDGPDTVNDLLMSLTCGIATILVVVGVRAWKRHWGLKRVRSPLWLPGARIKKTA